MNVGKIPEAMESLPESSVSGPVESEPEPPPPEKPAPPVLKAVYLPHETAVNPAMLTSFLETLAGTEINAVMLDIKNAQGQILVQTANEKAVEWEAVVSNALDLRAFAEILEQKNLHLIVRMHAFRDPLAASKGRLEYAIAYQNMEYLWLDAAAENGGRPWLNPYSANTREYLTSLAMEAVDAGAKMVVLDSVQFPDGSGMYATFGEGSQGIGRTQALHDFVAGLTEKADEKDVRVAVYLPAASISTLAQNQNVIRYGEEPLKIAEKDLLLGLMPEQLEGSTFAAVGEGGSPLVFALDSANAQAEASEILPLLSGALPAADVKTQLEAIKAAGAQEYILYSADGKYPYLS